MRSDTKPPAAVAALSGSPTPPEGKQVDPLHCQPLGIIHAEDMEHTQVAPAPEQTYVVPSQSRSIPATEATGWGVLKSGGPQGNAKPHPFPFSAARTEG